MSKIYMDVNIALSGVPVNIAPLIDDTDFKTREEAVTFNQAGMDLVWNFTTTAGVTTQTPVTPTDTGGVHDWVNKNNAMYTLEIPATGGTINNNVVGSGWFTGFATGIYPWVGPMIIFRAAGINDKMIDSAYDLNRGLAGLSLPAAAAQAANGLYTIGTGAGQINQPANGLIDINLLRIFGSGLSESGAGRLAAAFVKLFDVVTPELSSSDWTAAKAAFINAAISSRAPSGEYNTQLDATISSRSSHTAAGAANAVWSTVIEGSKSAVQFMRIMFAILRGKDTGGGTNTLTYYGDNGIKVRHTETVDNDGNRTAVSSDGS